MGRVDTKQKPWGSWSNHIHCRPSPWAIGNHNINGSTIGTEKYRYIKIWVSKDPLDTKNHTRSLDIFLYQVSSSLHRKRSSLVILLVSGVHKSDFLPGKNSMVNGGQQKLRRQPVGICGPMLLTFHIGALGNGFCRFATHCAASKWWHSRGMWEQSLWKVQHPATG